MTYIQLTRNGQRETVDEYGTRREALAMVKEYRLADPTGHYYLSSRACKGWQT